MSRQELADAINDYLWEVHRQRSSIDRSYVGKLERGKHTWPGRMLREAFRVVLEVDRDSDIGFFPIRTPRTTSDSHSAEAPTPPPAASVLAALPVAPGAARSETGAGTAGSGILVSTPGRAGGELIQTGDTDSRRPDLTGREGTEGDMHRRVMLQRALIALGAGAAGPALDVIRTGLVSSLLGQDAADIDVAEWEEVADEYGRAFYTESPTALVAHLAADLADLQETLAADHGGRQVDLSRVAAQLAAIMAMSLTSTGQFQTARRWWRTCRRAADASGDPAVRVWVRSQDAISALYDRRPIQTAIERAEEALAIGGGRAYPGTAESLAARAQAAARAGDVAGARRQTELLTDVFGKLSTEVTTDTVIYNWPQRRLWHTTSYVYSHLGRSAEAMRAQEQALALTPEWAPSSRAQVRLHTAMCLVRDGDLDAGADHAQRVITALPPSRQTALVLRVGQAVLDAVPAGERSRPAVAGLREAIAASAGPVVS